MELKLDLEVVSTYIQSQSLESRVYIGADSEVQRKNGVWYAQYSIAIAIHRIIDGIGRGCKVFGEIVTEPVYDKDRRKPSMRLMTEAFKLGEMYNRLEPFLEGREVALHIDINRDAKFASNAVLDQALGYLKGVTGIDADAKPLASCASFCADRLPELIFSSAGRGMISTLTH